MISDHGLRLDIHAALALTAAYGVQSAVAAELLRSAVAGILEAQARP